MIKGKRKPKETLSLEQAKKKPVDQLNAWLKDGKKPVAKEKKTPTTKPSGMTRSDLMNVAKERGIKYFRILNKEELECILHLDLDADRNVADDIIAVAKARWQAGWSKNKQAQSGAEGAGK